MSPTPVRSIPSDGSRDTVPASEMSSREIEREIQRLEREERLEELRNNGRGRGRGGDLAYEPMVEEERRAYNLATAGFICSLGFVLLSIFALPASIVGIVLSSKALRKMRQFGPYSRGRGLAKAGLIIGIIGVAISAIFLLALALQF